MARVLQDSLCDSGGRTKGWVSTFLRDSHPGGHSSTEEAVDPPHTPRSAAGAPFPHPFPHPRVGEQALPPRPLQQRHPPCQVTNGGIK